MESELDVSKINVLSAKSLPIAPGMLKRSAGGGDQPLEVFQAITARYDDALMNWINASDENKRAFLEDPVGSLQRATGLDAETMAQLKKISPQVMEALAAQAPQEAAQAPEAVKGAVSAVSVHGWDIVSAIKIGKINKLLTYAYSKNILPQKLHYETSIHAFGLTIPLSIDGSFSAPYISGINGQNLNITFPLPNFVVTVNGMAFPLTKASTVVLTVGLNCVETRSAKNNAVYTFYLTLAQDAVSNAVANNIPAELLQTLGGAGPASGYLKDGVLSACNGASVKICSVSSDQIPSGYQFMIPKVAKYTGLKRATVEESVLAILMLTVTPESNKLTWTVDDAIIPDKCDGSVVLSNDLVIKNMLLPAVASAFQISTDKLKTRVCDPDNGSYQEIYNKEAFNYYKKVKGYTLSITSLKFSEHKGTASIHMEAHVTPTSGITLYYTADGEYTASFTAGSGKTQALELTEKTFTSKHNTDIAAWVYVVAALAGLITAFVSGPVVAAILAALSEAITAIIGSVINSKAPALNFDTFSSAASTVQWEHADIVTFKTVGLYGDLQLGVTIPILDK